MLETEIETTRESRGNKSQLDIHHVMKNPETTVTCDKCGNSFNNRIQLREHRLKHTIQKKKSKPKIKDTSLNAKRVSQKILSDSNFETLFHNPIGHGSYKCDACQRQFNSTDNLKKHVIQLHAGGRSSNCDICNQYFITRKNLQAHLLTHTILKSHAEGKSSENTLQPSSPKPIYGNAKVKIEKENRGSKTKQACVEMDDKNKRVCPEQEFIKKEETCLMSKHVYHKKDAKLEDVCPKKKVINVENNLKTNHVSEKNELKINTTDTISETRHIHPEEEVNKINKDIISEIKKTCYGTEVDNDIEETVLKTIVRMCNEEVKMKDESNSLESKIMFSVEEIMEMEDPLENMQIFSDEDLEMNINNIISETRWECSEVGAEICIEDPISEMKRSCAEEQVKMGECVPQGKHACNVCKKNLSSKRSLQNHILIHMGEKPHKCKTCGQIFRLKHHLARHLRSHSTGSSQMWKVCGKSLNAKPPPIAPYLAHEKYAEEVKSPGLENLHDLEEVTTKLRGIILGTGYVFSEEEVEKKSESDNLEIQSVFSEGEINKMEDPLESIDIFSERELEIHIDNMISEIKPDFCDAGVEEGTGDTRSERKCPSPRKKKKCLCVKDELKISRSRTKHTCNVCKRNFGLKRDLKDHMLMHTGEKLHKCEVCDRGFRARYSLRRHLHSHTAEENVALNARNKHFKTKPSVNLPASKQDNWIEEGNGKDLPRGDEEEVQIQMKYTCHVCHKNFSNNACLDIHFLIHPDEKPYKCGVCGRCYTLRNYLERHLEMHATKKLQATSESVLNKSRSNEGVVQRNQNEDVQIYIQDTNSDIKHLCFEKKVKIEIKDENLNRKGLTVSEQVGVVGKISQAKNTCDVCQKTFSSKGNLKRHLSVIHAVDKPYKCDVCNKCFSLRCTLEEHGRTHATEKIYVCNICSKSFSDESRLNEHNVVHRNQVLEVEMKGESVKNGHGTITQNNVESPNLTKRHIQPEGEIKKIQIKDIHSVEKHFSVVKEVKSGNISSDTQNYPAVQVETNIKDSTKNVCGICQKIFSTKSKLKIHLFLHSGERPFKCEVCQKRSKTKSNFKVHLLVHKEDKPHKCHLCNRSFCWRQNLKVHLEAHESGRLHTCAVCGMGFSKTYQLKKHTLVHGNEEKVESKDTSSEAELVGGEGRMASRDTGETKTLDSVQEEVKLDDTRSETEHMCDICTKCFLTAKSLRQHQLVHTGKQPHTCSLCDKTFRLRNKMRSHMKMHKRAGPHKCKVCGIVFHTASKLKSHRYVHTVVKPYMCVSCGKAFCRKEALEEHVMSHGKNEGFNNFA